MNKPDFGKIKKVFNDFFRALARHTFLTLLVLLCLALLLGEFLFYQYSVLPEKKEPQVSGQALQFREDLYQKVQVEWQAREERFEGASAKEYPDPFKVD
jgi:hypothetical protein